MTALVDEVRRIARAEIGTREGRSGGHWDNDQKYSDEVPGLAWSDGQPWCQTFVTWVAMRAGAQALYHPVASPTASCDAAGAWFRTVGRWSEYPAIGAQIFFGSSRDLDHTGIVVDYDDDLVHTVEGNTNDTGSREGNGVYAKTHRRRDPRVVGYGYPRFPEGIRSAAPAARTTKAGVPAQARAGTSPGVGARVDGVDLSHHNRGVTRTALTQAAAAGVRFVYHKATEGHGFVDEQYRTRRRLAAAVGLPFGAYHFARPGRSTGQVQARHLLDVATPRPGDLVPVLDLEDDGGLGRRALTAWVRAFVGEVRDRTGARPLVYTPFDLDDSCGCGLWVARYNDAMRPPRVPAPWTAYDVWQFSDGRFGRPAGVPGLGRVDLDTLAGDPAAALARLLLPGEQAGPAVSVPAVRPPGRAGR